MGHWDKGKVANPTLLASGFTPWDPNKGIRKILVYMWPIQVETDLTSNLPNPAPDIVLTDDRGDPTGKTKPNLNVPVAYDKGVSELWPAAWEMKWTLKTEGRGDPLAPLIAAQEVWAALGSSGVDIPDKPPAQGIWDNDYSSAKKPLKVAKGLIKTKGTNTVDNENTADDDFWDAAPKEWADTPHVLSLPDGGVSKVITWSTCPLT
jgi:hypothetical protein